MSDKEIMKEMRRRQLMEGINRSSEAMVSMQEQTRRAEATAAMEEQALHASQGLASQQLQFVQGMATEADLRENAGAATLKESAGERKKRREREQTRQKALRQGRRVRDLEGGLLPQRVDVFDSQQLTGEQARQEKLLLKEKLKEILLEREAKLKEAESNGPLDEAARRKLDWETQAEQAKAAGEYARILTPGSKERREAMDVKERMELKADNLKRLYKLTQIANPAEREREAETLKRHNRYDKLKSIFRKDNPLSHEDAVWRHPENGHVLVNVGRAYFGGTKPMYIFEDRNEPIDVPGGQTRYKQYLFKEATNCVGHYKPEGALVTEAAANLQKIICGDYAISAFAAVADGKVLGSFQEKLDVRSREEGAVDLFSWQADPTASSAPDGDVKREILREHTLDWLLCNFDTKGENFLNRTDGHLSSFDK
ncbi:MAG: hypothetical protein LBP30_03160, partial [Clostridiales Family XIII bacterium]|nr:hypothetical protein [Clostridiales Family XIII bacterium]